MKAHNKNFFRKGIHLSTIGALATLAFTTPHHLFGLEPLTSAGNFQTGSAETFPTPEGLNSLVPAERLASLEKMISADYDRKASIRLAMEAELSTSEPSSHVSGQPARATGPSDQELNAEWSEWHINHALMVAAEATRQSPESSPQRPIPELVAIHEEKQRLFTELAKAMATGGGTSATAMEKSTALLLENLSNPPSSSPNPNSSNR